VGGAGQQLGQAPRQVADERRVRVLGRRHVGHVDPLVGAAAVHEVAAQRLSSVQPVAGDAPHAHERDGLGGDHLHAGRRQRQPHAEHVGELPGLRTGGDHDHVGAERAPRRLHRGHPPAALHEPGHGRVLQDPPAVILQGPRVGLHGALRVGVAAEVQVGAADRVVADDGDQLLELAAVERVPAEAARLADLGPPARQRELRLAQRYPDPARLVLGGVTEKLVHLRPQSLLLEPQRAVDVGGAAAVAPRRLPADDPLLEHEHVDAGPGQPPAGAEPRHPAAHDHHRRSARRHGGHHRPAGDGSTRGVCSRRSSSPGM
jgi:hypothetical protein